jgi:hypothetical protein
MLAFNELRVPSFKPPPQEALDESARFEETHWVRWRLLDFDTVSCLIARDGQAVCLVLKSPHFIWSRPALRNDVILTACSGHDYLK